MPINIYIRMLHRVYPINRYVNSKTERKYLHILFARQSQTTIQLRRSRFIIVIIAVAVKVVNNILLGSQAIVGILHRSGLSLEQIARVAPRIQVRNLLSRAR